MEFRISSPNTGATSDLASLSVSFPAIRFVAINTASLLSNFTYSSINQGNMNGGEVDMLVDQLPIVEPNNNGNQVQPPEEIFVGNDNHQAPAEEEAVTSGKLLGGDYSNGTSHLRSHVKSCIQKRIHDGSQKFLGPNLLIKGKTELVATAYNAEVSRKELATVVLMHEYPLSIVEHLHFKRFCYSLRPLFSFPSRNTLKRDVMRMYFDERAKIQSSRGRLLDPHRSKLHFATVEALMCIRSWLKDEYERDPAIGNNIVELEGCFTALDIISGSDDEPIDIEDQGFAKMRTQRAASCCLSNEMP
ncbi:Putative AC transposase [Linum perenne]